MSYPINNIKFSQEYADLVPRPNDDEYQKLKEDIIDKGIEEPLVINDENVLLDGYTRYDIAKSIGLEKVPVSQRHFDSILDEKSYVLRKAILRRHLNPVQKANIASELKKIYEKQAEMRKKATYPQKGQKGFQKSNDVCSENNTLDKGSVRDMVTKQVGISSKTLQTAEDVKNIDKILKNPENQKDIVKEWEDAKNGKTSVKHVQEKLKELKDIESGKPVAKIPECTLCNNEGKMKNIILCEDCYKKILEKKMNT